MIGEITVSAVALPSTFAIGGEHTQPRSNAQ